MRIIICLILLAFSLYSCEEDKPELADFLFFECYDPSTFGPLRPEKYDGLPGGCMKVLYAEDFADNTQKWYEESNSQRKIKVTNGVYDFNNPSNINYHLYFKFSDLEKLSQYQLDVDLKILSGTTNNCSLNWGGNGGWENTFRFGFDKSSKYTIAINKAQATPAPLVPLTYSALIDVNNFNKLTVRFYKGTHYLFINKTLVFRTDKIIPYGKEAGFRVGAISTCQFDNFTITSFGL